MDSIYYKLTRSYTGTNYYHIKQAYSNIIYIPKTIEYIEEFEYCGLFDSDKKAIDEVPIITICKIVNDTITVPIFHTGIGEKLDIPMCSLLAYDICIKLTYTTVPSYVVLTIKTKNLTVDEYKRWMNETYKTHRLYYIKDADIFGK